MGRGERAEIGYWSSETGPLPEIVVAFFVTIVLTVVSVSVTFRQILARRGTPFARALSKDGASAVPAGGGYALRSRADPGH